MGCVFFLINLQLYPSLIEPHTWFLDLSWEQIASASEEFASVEIACNGHDDLCCGSLVLDDSQIADPRALFINSNVRQVELSPFLNGTSRDTC